LSRNPEFSTKSFTPATVVVSPPAGRPGMGKPAVRLGTKNVTEELILGQLYAQALQAKGFTVQLTQAIGPTEVIDPALLNGTIDMYPEYTGEIVSTLTNIALGAPGGAGQRAAPPPPDSWQKAYEQAANFEDRRGFTLLQPSPFQNADELAVLKTFAAKHHLTDIGQLSPPRHDTSGRLAGLTAPHVPTIFQYESLRTILSPRSSNRSQPRTSTFSPATVVPVSSHSEQPRSPLLQWRSSP
jgi:glycine betaine/choline ABC-type transport system substrate-binding protein